MIGVVRAGSLRGRFDDSITASSSETTNLSKKGYSSSGKFGSENQIRSPTPRRGFTSNATIQNNARQQSRGSIPLVSSTEDDLASDNYNSDFILDWVEYKSGATSAEKLESEPILTRKALFNGNRARSTRSVPLEWSPKLDRIFDNSATNSNAASDINRLPNDGTLIVKGISDPAPSATGLKPDDISRQGPLDHIPIASSPELDRVFDNSPSSPSIMFEIDEKPEDENWRVIDNFSDPSTKGTSLTEISRGQQTSYQNIYKVPKRDNIFLRSSKRNPLPPYRGTSPEREALPDGYS